MRYQLNCLELWLLKKIFKRAVIQSHQHANNITKIYTLLHEAARDQFTEENSPTLDDFLRERFELSQELTPDFKIKQ